MKVWKLETLIAKSRQHGPHAVCEHLQASGVVEKGARQKHDRNGRAWEHREI